ncbi:16S rRNA (cytidine(1402)-2'-O)-methyltransferase [Yunchengibacter salinarum]|uniref:16S rRNA (cytidine(1402)-2'-O)-methyltransferase n=1 Tax=Yunchengibacter salinarum TaxID=3133399 RepID=UPI0035B5F5C1
MTKPQDTPPENDPLEHGLLAPGLYIVGTPIGNLGDLSPRGRDTLARVDRIACEDTRVTGRLTGWIGSKASLTAYHDHNAARVRPGLLAALAREERVALVSDAGMPLISDPGYKLVAEARAAGHPVRVVPGPSAVSSALALAGLPTNRFLFAGFPPPKTAARRRWYAEQDRANATLVVFESAKRVAASLQDAAGALGNRPVALCREITKRFETVLEGRLDDLTERLEASPVKGEIVLVIAPAPEKPTEIRLTPEGILEKALETMTVSAAARFTAELTGRPRKALYQRALEIADDPDTDA